MGEVSAVAVYGSPRSGGNSDQLLDNVVAGAEHAGARVKRLYVRDLVIGGCTGCDGCLDSGQCVIRDDMVEVYTLLGEAEVVFVATPVYFYGVPAQLKGVIDRCQALFRDGGGSGGDGYLVAVGATGGKRLFDGIVLTIRYFLQAIGKVYRGEIVVRYVDEVGAVEGKDYAGVRDDAFQLGVDAIARRT